MKKLLILFAIMTTLLNAQEYKVNKDGFMIPTDNKYEWTTSSKTLLYTYFTLSAIDLAQTIHFLEKGTAHEANPLFGKHPKTWKIVTAKVVGSYLIYEIFDNMIPESHRLYFLTVFVAVQGYVVYHNSQFVNIKISF